MDINLDNIEVTAVEVFDFMCEQAKEDPLILVILYSVLVSGTYHSTTMNQNKRQVSVSSFSMSIAFYCYYDVIFHTVLICLSITIVYIIGHKIGSKCASVAKKEIIEKVILLLL